MTATYLFLKGAKLSFALLVVLDFIYRNPGCLIEDIARAMHATEQGRKVMKKYYSL